MSGLQAIIFDLGNVLIQVDEARARTRFAARTGKTEQDIERYFHSTSYATELALGKLAGRRFYRIVSKDLGFDGTYEEFAETWSDIFEPIEPMVKLASALATRLPRVILSNTNAIHIEHIFARYPFLQEFDAHVFSHEVGFLKPDAAIYRLTLDKCGLEPERTLFVDDLRANVEGARAVGMRAIQFESAEQVRQELTNLGVSPI
jgi:epoxide hydrolase-like predicted phosphatase